MSQVHPWNSAFLLCSLPYPSPLPGPAWFLDGGLSLVTMISGSIHFVSTCSCHREVNSSTQERGAIENIKARSRKETIVPYYHWYLFLNFLPHGLCLHPNSWCLGQKWSLSSFLGYMWFFVGSFSSIRGHIYLPLINSPGVDLQAYIHWKKFKWL